MYIINVQSILYSVHLIWRDQSSEGLDPWISADYRQMQEHDPDARDGGRLGRAAHNGSQC